MHSPAKLALLAVILVFATTFTFAQSQYYVLTNDEGTANSATIFNLNPKDGSLTEVRTLKTGGGSYTGGFYAAETQVITPGGQCIFVADGANNANRFALLVAQEAATRDDPAITAVAMHQA